jgi:hypothetical protein
MQSRVSSFPLAGLLVALVLPLLTPVDASALVLCTKQKNGKSKSFFRTNDKCPRSFRLFSVPGDFLCWDRRDTGVRGECDLSGPDNEDLNGDGECDADDCKAAACWDLNGNQQPDVATEDFNGDGEVDLEDCRTFLDFATTPGAEPGKLATLRITRDTTQIFQQGGPDGTTLLIDAGRPWPTASTAEAFLSDPMDCGALQYARTIDAAGNLTCAPITDADVPDTITASALASDPMDCGAGFFATSIGTQGDLGCTPITDADIPDNISVLRANALATDPSPCGPGQFVTDVADTGTLGCTGITDADVPDTITVAKANALATDPAACAAGQFVTDVADTGLLGCAAITDADIPDTITAATANALATDPSPCATGQFVTDLADTGTLGCTAITDADVPDTITVEKANALATDPTACDPDSFVTDIADTGALTCAPIGDITVAKADALSVDPTACPANQFVRDISDTGTLDCDPLPSVPTTLPVSEDPAVATTGAVAIDENGDPDGTPPQLIARAGSGASPDPLVLDPRHETTVVLNAPTVGQSTVAFRAFEDATILSISCIADMLDTGDTVGVTVRQLPPSGTDLDDVEAINCTNASTDVVASAVDAPELAKGAWVTVRIDSVTSSTTVDQVALSITYAPKQSVVP